MTERPGDRRPCPLPAIGSPDLSQAGRQFTVSLKQLDEELREIRIELRTCVTFDLVQCPVDRTSRLVGTAVGDRVERIREPDDARLERDVVARETIGVAGAIEVLVV